MHSAALLLASGLALASAKPALTAISADYDFDQYVSDFKLHKQAASWANNASELSLRKALFETEVAKVKAHNSRATSSYKIGLNRFSVMTADEKKATLGHNKAMRQAHAREHVGGPAKHEVRKRKRRRRERVETDYLYCINIYLCADACAVVMCYCVLCCRCPVAW